MAKNTSLVVQKNDELVRTANLIDPSGKIDTSSLTPAAKEKCLEITKGITDLQSLHSYGSEFGSVQSQSSSKLLEMSKLDKAGAVGEEVQKIMDAIRETEYQDPSTMGGFRGLVAKIPVIGTAMVKHYDKGISRRFDSSKDVVDKLIVALGQQETELKLDFNALEAMEGQTQDYVKQLQIHIVALQVRCDEDRKKLGELREQQANDPSSVDPFEIDDLAEMLEEEEKHKHNLLIIEETARNVTLPQINLMKVNAYNLYKSSDEIKRTIIPTWEGSIARALIGVSMKKIADTQKQVRDTTNRLIVEGAKQTRELNKQIREESMRGAIDIAAYVEAYNTVTQTMVETQEMALKAVEERKKCFDKIREANEKNSAVMKKLAAEQEKLLIENPTNYFEGKSVKAIGALEGLE